MVCQSLAWGANVQLGRPRVGYFLLDIEPATQEIIIIIDLLEELIPKFFY